MVRIGRAWQTSDSVNAGDFISNVHFKVVFSFSCWLPYWEFSNPWTKTSQKAQVSMPINYSIFMAIYTVFSALTISMINIWQECLRFHFQRATKKYFPSLAKLHALHIFYLHYFPTVSRFSNVKLFWLNCMFLIIFLKAFISFSTDDQLPSSLYLAMTWQLPLHTYLYENEIVDHFSEKILTVA